MTQVHNKLSSSRRYSRPKWLRFPESTTIFIGILISYFLVCGGIIYDMVIEPPAMGSMRDRNGAVRPVAFMPNRINGQYIVEGLTASLFFVLGSIGFIILERSNTFENYQSDDHIPDKCSPPISSVSSTKRSIPGENLFLTVLAFMLIMISFAVCWMFMLTKLPGYLH